MVLWYESHKSTGAPLSLPSMRWLEAMRTPKVVPLVPQKAHLLVAYWVSGFFMLEKSEQDLKLKKYIYFFNCANCQMGREAQALARATWLHRRRPLPCQTAPVTATTSRNTHPSFQLLGSLDFTFWKLSALCTKANSFRLFKKWELQKEILNRCDVHTCSPGT